jgi:hypothetical protein
MVVSVVARKGEGGTEFGLRLAAIFFFVEISECRFQIADL